MIDFATATPWPSEPAPDSSPRTVSGVYPRVTEPTPCTRQLIGSVVELTRLTDRGERNAELAELSVRTVERLSDLERPDGLLARVGGLAPRLWPRIDAVREHHDAIRILASTLFRYARTDAPQAMVHMTLESLNEALRHNAEETDDLIQDALLTDPGGEG